MKRIAGLLFLLVVLAIPAHTPSAQAAVPDSPQEVHPLLIGAAVPDVNVFGVDGSPVSLSELTTGTPSLLIFYRGGW